MRAQLHEPPRRAETLQELAMSLGVSYDSFLRAAHDGRLRTIRIGKRLLVPADEASRISNEGLPQTAPKSVPRDER